MVGSLLVLEAVVSFVVAFVVAGIVAEIVVVVVGVLALLVVGLLIRCFAVVVADGWIAVAVVVGFHLFVLVVVAVSFLVQLLLPNPLI